MVKEKAAEKTEQSIMNDILITLSALSVISVYYYGIRAVLVMAAALSAAVISDMLCIKLRKRFVTLIDFSASAVTGLTVALMMSAAAPYYAVVTASVFAAVIARQAFGGQGHEIFNPAAAGFLFSLLCFGGEMLSYPKPFEALELSSAVPHEYLSRSANSVLMSTAIPPVQEMIEILIGRLLSPMGAAHLLLLAVCAFALIIRGSISAIAFLTQLGIVTVFSYIYFDYNLLSVLNLLGGSMFLYGIIFLSCVKIKTRRTKLTWFIIGVLTSVIFIALQFYSKTEIAIVYAVTITAPIALDLDRHALSFAGVLHKGNAGLLYKVRSKFNKQLAKVNETLTILEDRDNGASDGSGED